MTGKHCLGVGGKRSRIQSLKDAHHVEQPISSNLRPCTQLLLFSVTNRRPLSNATVRKKAARMAYPGGGGPQQAVASPTSSATYPLSPRSSVPSYIRRSSAVSSILGGGSNRDSVGAGGSSNSAGSASSARNSTLPSTPTTANSGTGASSYFGSSSTAVGTSNGPPDVLERPRDRTRNAEVASSALTFLYAEIVAYTQDRVTGISDLERK